VADHAPGEGDPRKHGGEGTAGERVFAAAAQHAGRQQDLNVGRQLIAERWYELRGEKPCLENPRSSPLLFTSHYYYDHHCYH